MIELEEFKEKWKQKAELEHRAQKNPQDKPRYRPSAGFLVAIGAIVLYVSGSFHFLHGSATGFMVLKKASFSLSETVVNTDRLGNMPAFLARAEYPMTIAAMSRKAIASGAVKDYRVARERIGLGMMLSDVYREFGMPTEPPDTYTIGGDETTRLTYSDMMQGKVVFITLTNGRVTRISD